MPRAAPLAVVDSRAQVAGRLLRLKIDTTQSGIGREECMEEMLAYTQEKNIHVKLKPLKG
jgi:hypothetical protein